MTISQPQYVPSWPIRIAKSASAFAILIGVYILLGWSLYFWMSETLLHYIVIVQPNLAICFVLAGIALWIKSENQRISYISYLAEFSSAAIFLVGALTLCEYFFQIDLGIDQGIFDQPLSNAIDIFPTGRMAPLAALNLVLIGFTLFFLDNKIISHRIYQIFIFFVILSAFFSFLVHIYRFNTVAILGFDRYSQMSILSITVFLFLGLGIILSRPRLGVASLLISSESGGSFSRRLIPPAVILPIMLGYVGMVGLGEDFYAAELGISLIVMGTIIFFISFILVNAYFVDKVDVERKEIERVLKLNQAQLHAFFNNTSAITYIYDLEGRFILINKQFEKVYHRSSAEVIGKSNYDLFTKEIADKLTQNNMTVLQTRESLAIEEVLSLGNGSRSYISNKFPLYNEEGIPYAVGGISTDITEIKHISDVLQESKERLNLALTSAQAGAWSWDIPSDKLVWDEYMHYLFGIKNSSFVGQNAAFFNLIHPDDRNKVKAEMENALESGTMYESEFRTIHSDGSIRYLGTKGKVYRDEYGDPVRMAGVCWDITAHKKAEEELRRAKEIAEELAQQAAEASRAKSTFLAAMSHEIRTPLNGVIGTTSLLLDTTLSGEQREFIETIRVSGEALLSVINDILDFSKIESERMELDFRDFDIHGLVEDAMDIFAAQIHRKGLSIGAFIEPEVPQWLTGDPARIRQVLTNILSNAGKFTEKGEISIKVKLLTKDTMPTDEEKLIVLFEVSDTGIGITPEVRQRLFQPFSQGDATTSRRYGGTGLGLAICKRLVEMMGGQIDVQGVPGQGSKFWFTVEVTASPVPVMKVEYELAHELTGMHILCVDDSAINREIIKRQTEAWKMRCDVALNAAEALSKLKKAAVEKDPYVLALVDTLMPGMSGVEMIQIMRQLKEISQTPVIILSSLGTTMSTDDMKAYGISLSLTKPLRPNKLYDGIVAVLIKMHGKAETIDAPVKAKAPSRNQNFRILLSEDNPINRQVALKILHKMGYKTDVACNGLEAVAAYKSGSYDLVLMDCQMPEMDGYTATAEIRMLERETQKHTPIIAMTAYALKGDKEKCLAAGMDDYISKPIDIKALINLLHEWLKDSENDEEVAEEVRTIQAEPLTRSAFDMERIHSIFGDDPKDIAEFVKVFISSTTETLDEITVAIKGRDVKLLKNLFHRLKGSAGNSGVVQMHKIAQEAEKKVLDEKWDEVDTEYQKIIEEFNSLIKESEVKFQIPAVTYTLNR